MKILRVWVVASLLIVGAGVALGQEDAAPEQADKFALQAVRDAIVAAYNRQDVEALVSHFHEDIGYLVPSRPYVSGRDAVKEMYVGVFARFKASDSCGYLKAQNEDVVIAGEWAWVRGESQFIRSTCGSVPSFPSDLAPGSKHMGIYKKENGKWLRYRQMRNGNTPDMNI